MPLEFPSADKLQAKIRQNDAGKCVTAGQVVFSSHIGCGRKAMIKTQPRFCLILQRMAKLWPVCISSCGKRSLSDYLIFGSFYQEKEQTKPQRQLSDENDR
jgi:hypothetical protein